MNSLQIKEVEQDLIRQSKGDTVEYVALVKGSQAVIFPGWWKTRYNHYISNGYVHMMSALDGDLLPLY